MDVIISKLSSWLDLNVISPMHNRYHNFDLIGPSASAKFPEPQLVFTSWPCPSKDVIDLSKLVVPIEFNPSSTAHSELDIITSACPTPKMTLTTRSNQTWLYWSNQADNQPDKIKDPESIMNLIHVCTRAARLKQTR